MGERDLGRGERDLARGERDLARGERDLARGDMLRRGGLRSFCGDLVLDLGRPPGEEERFRFLSGERDAFLGLERERLRWLRSALLRPSFFGDRDRERLLPLDLDLERRSSPTLFRGD